MKSAEAPALFLVECEGGLNPKNEEKSLQDIVAC